MSELTFEQMLDASLKTIHAGEVVEGTVIDVKPEEAVLNIGYKSDGILTRNEYSNDSNLDLTTIVKPGDTMEVKVLKVNDGEGQVALSYKRLAADRGYTGSGRRSDRRCGRGSHLHPCKPCIRHLREGSDQV